MAKFKGTSNQTQQDDQYTKYAEHIEASVLKNHAVMLSAAIMMLAGQIF
jgi:hypothetical protein